MAVRGLTKRFGQFVALDGVSVRFAQGEVHAVVGENGAGKSTLMGHLAGFLVPDEGEVSLDGNPLPLGDPLACKRLGIAMVHQHFTLVDALSVLENVALASGLSGVVDWRALGGRVEELLRAYGWDLDLRARVETLSVGQKQKLEILKALWSEGGVLILDEPTATLAEDEVRDLFALLRDLASRGMAVLLIAHKLREVLSVADRITVLRAGRVVRTVTREEADEHSLTTWMVGEVPPMEPSEPPTVERPRIFLRDVKVLDDDGRVRVRGVSLDVRPGEIVGISGVDGNGQLELAEAVVGIRRVESGEILIDGEPVGRHTEEVGYVPQDRHRHGLALPMSIGENVLIGLRGRGRFFWGPFLRSKAFQAHLRDLIDRFGIACRGPGQPVWALSGGNQQKVVLARALDPFPRVVVAVDPTRGLDVRATMSVHNALLSAAKRGAAVLLLSGSREEIAALSHRAHRISMGRLEPWEDVHREELVLC